MRLTVFFDEKNRLNPIPLQKNISRGKLSLMFPDKYADHSGHSDQNRWLVTPLHGGEKYGKSSSPLSSRVGIPTGSLT